jgi:putative tryptophan/tyrosine transport system substrate-binding protein
VRRRGFLAVLPGLAVLPLHAQGVPRLALADPAWAPEDMVIGGYPYWSALLTELRKLGYIEGKSIEISRWSGLGDFGTYDAMVKKVLASRPTILVTRTRTLTVVFAKADTRTPIVMLGSVSPDLAESLARPGHNVTGVYVSAGGEQIYAKQLEFLSALVRRSGRIAWLGPRELWDTLAGEAARKGTRQAGISIEPVLVANPVTRQSITAAFAAMRTKRFDAMLVAPATALGRHYEAIAALAIEARLPSMTSARLGVQAGMLMSYGADFEELWRRAAHQVDRILRGAKPGDVPIEQPTKVELAINLKTAKALNLTIPASLQVRADHLFE